LGGHQYTSAISSQQPAICDKGVYRTLVHGDIEQSVTGNVKCDRCRGGERHRTHIRLDQTLIADVRAQHCDIAAIGIDRAPIDHLAANPVKTITTGSKVGIGHVQGRCHQTCDVNLRSLTEQHSVRVYQEDLSIGGQIAEDGGWILADHPVEGDRFAVGLDKLDRVALSDVETFPVDRRLLACLVNCHRRAGSGDSRVA